MHPQEAFLQTLRAHQHDPEGRAHLRHRTIVEHSLARVDQIQGPKARYKGTRRSTFDLRRVAAVAKLQRLARLPKAA
jgi:IS5 family transposase